MKQTPVTNEDKAVKRVTISNAFGLAQERKTPLKRGVLSSKKYPKHYAPDSGEWVPHIKKMKWQCCDCGLVHNVSFDLGTLLVKMTRNSKETKLARQGKKKLPEDAKGD